MPPETHEYDGSLTAIWDLLREIEKKVDIHIVQEQELKPKINELLDLLSVSKGAMKFIKYMAVIAAACAAVCTWAGNYWTWRGH